MYIIENIICLITFYKYNNNNNDVHDDGDNNIN